MPGFAETTGQPAANLPKQLGLTDLTKHHGHELLRATEPFGAVLCPGYIDSFK
jgi:hypothetical protein